MNFNDIENLLNEQANIKHDKFYTKPEVAKKCLNQLNLKSYDRIIEPSAGSGSFSKQIPNCEAYDLVPEDKSIKKQDFLKFNTEKGNILVVGNPPFGKSNSLTLAFINNAAKFARTIAFIVPSSCRKDTFINRLSPNVHLRRVVELPKNSFIINGTIPYDVNCCFMIFDVRKKERVKREAVVSKDFTFVPKDRADLCIKRKGWKVGRIIPFDSDIREASRYYIKSNLPKNKLKERINSLDYPESHMVLGSDSLSQQEILRAYVSKYGR